MSKFSGQIFVRVRVIRGSPNPTQSHFLQTLARRSKISPSLRQQKTQIHKGRAELPASNVIGICFSLLSAISVFIDQSYAAWPVNALH
jgi:hypothetical protein